MVHVVLIVQVLMLQAVLSVNSVVMMVHVLIPVFLALLLLDQ